MDLIHYKKCQTKKLDTFAPRYVNIWRSMDQIIDEKFIAKDIS